MAVLFDPADEYVCSVLEQAKVHGEISLADLESIIKAGKDVQITPDEDDVADTIDALVAMGVEIALVSAIRRRARARRNEILEIMPQLIAAAGRQIPSKRIWIQNVFTRLAARIRSLHRRMSSSEETPPPPGEGLSRRYTRADVERMDALARQIKAQKEADKAAAARRSHRIHRSRSPRSS